MLRRKLKEKELQRRGKFWYLIGNHLYIILKAKLVNEINKGESINGEDALSKHSNAKLRETFGWLTTKGGVSTMKQRLGSYSLDHEWRELWLTLQQNPGNLPNLDFAWWEKAGMRRPSYCLLGLQLRSLSLNLNELMFGKHLEKVPDISCNSSVCWIDRFTK